MLEHGRVFLHAPNGEGRSDEGCDAEINTLGDALMRIAICPGNTLLAVVSNGYRELIYVNS